MAVLTVQQSDLDGETLNFVATNSGGDEFPNNGRTYIILDNQDTADKTVTVNSITACNQGFDHDVSISVTAGTQVTSGPFEQSRFDNASGNVELTYSDVTSLTIAIVSL